MSEERPCIGIIQEILVPGDYEKRGAAVANISGVAVDAGDSQFASLKLAVTESCDSLSLACPAKNPVPKESGREHKRAPDGRDLRAQRTVADAAAGRTQCATSACSESGIATNLRIHDGIFSPEGVLCGAIPVDFCIEVVFVQTL